MPLLTLLTLLTALGLLLRQILRSGFVLIIKSPLSHFSASEVNLLSCAFSNFLLTLV